MHMLAGSPPARRQVGFVPWPAASPQAFIDDLVGRADIVEIINARVPLKKAGREYRACCPFHNEKTPSFWVSPAKQFYHCFGCGAHGTVLSFLMNYDRLPFVEAVEDLAAAAGRGSAARAIGAGRAAPAVSDDLYALMGKVATFYQRTAGWPPSGRAAYADEARPRRARRSRTFGIGYAPDAWNEVLKRFGASDASRAEAAWKPASSSSARKATATTTASATG